MSGIENGRTIGFKVREGWLVGISSELNSKGGREVEKEKGMKDGKEGERGRDRESK